MDLNETMTNIDAGRITHLYTLGCPAVYVAEIVTRPHKTAASITYTTPARALLIAPVSQPAYPRGVAGRGVWYPSRT